MVTRTSSTHTEHSSYTHDARFCCYCRVLRASGYGQAGVKLLTQHVDVVITVLQRLPRVLCSCHLPQSAAEPVLAPAHCQHTPWD